LDAVLLGGHRGRPAGLAQGEESVRCRNHRGWALVDGVDDLGVIDPTQIRRSDAKLRVSKLTLDDDQGYAFPRHLHGVRVTELMRCEPPSDASLNSHPS
jgi:hypothetical protein